MRVRATIALAAVAMLCLAACGIEDPYKKADAAEERGAARAQPRTETQAEPVGDVGATSPEEALERMASTLGNWTTATVEDAYARARALTAGDAWEQVRREGAGVIASAMRTPEPMTSRTTVETVDVRGSGDRRSAIVVTRGGVVGGGLSGEAYDYKITLATVERRRDGWVIARWAPQP
jgi:hypothetical protein